MSLCWFGVQLPVIYFLYENNGRYFIKIHSLNILGNSKNPLKAEVLTSQLVTQRNFSSQSRLVVE